MTAEQASPEELAIRAGRGEVVFALDLPGGGVHRHAFRVKRINWRDGEPSYYLEFEEPGACGCVRRLSLARATHAVLNTAESEILATEAREVCVGCGHKHHLDDAAVQVVKKRRWIHMAIHMVAHFLVMNHGTFVEQPLENGDDDVVMFFRCECGEEQDRAITCYHEKRCPTAARHLGPWPRKP